MSSDQEYFGSMFVRRCGPVIYTGAGSGSIGWAPPAGKRLVLKGCALRARVTTALVGATPGAHFCLCEVSTSNPILTIGVIQTATDLAGTDYGHVFTQWPGGYALASGEILRIGCTATVGAGVITTVGFVWGDEVI
jgi:hypothetical protein